MIHDIDIKILIAKIILGLIYMRIEQKLGRTDHGSVLDMIKNGILTVLKRTFTKRENKL